MIKTNSDIIWKLEYIEYTNIAISNESFQAARSTLKFRQIIRVSINIVN